jgi:hypothetical protein
LKLAYTVEIYVCHLEFKEVKKYLTLNIHTR